MLDTDKVIELRTALNLKHICKAGGLKYSTLNKKIYSHLKNPENGHISDRELKGILEGLKKCNLVYTDTNSFTNH